MKTPALIDRLQEESNEGLGTHMTSIAGDYVSAPHPSWHITKVDGSVSTALVVYYLVLKDDGTFKTARTISIDGIYLTDSSLHSGGYDPHEVWEGTWHLTGNRLVLADGAKSFEARVQPTNESWLITWESIEYRPKSPDYHPTGTVPVVPRK